MEIASAKSDKCSSTSVEIDVKRCLCIHALSQLVDITLQSLLYQRQIIPEPVSTLLKGDSNAAEQFRTVYGKVARILQETFRTPNIGRIAEFIIIIGGTTYSPKEIYRIPVPRCRCADHADERENEGEKPKEGQGCGPACGELSAKEKRLVFSAVALSKTAVGHFESCPHPSKTDKVFLFIRTRKGSLDTWTEGLVEDESFELPDEKLQQRRKIRQLRVQVHLPCFPGSRGAAILSQRQPNGSNGLAAANGHATESEDSEWEEGEGDENAMSLWYRIAPFFTNLTKSEWHWRMEQKHSQ